MTAERDKVDLTQAAIRKFLAEAGKKGGKARAAKLSKKRRSDIARKGGLAKAARTNQESK